jgi:subtilisin family serine protease
LEFSDHEIGASIRNLESMRHLKFDLATFKACYFNLLSAIADQDHVVNVVLKRKLRSLNDLAKSIVQKGDVSKVYPYTAAGLNGSSEVIGIGDTGLDENHCMFKNPDNSMVTRSSVNKPITDYTKRKVIQYINYGNNGDIAGGHGTHVCGTALGFNTADDNNFGHASAAKLAFFDMSADGRGLIYPQPMSTGMFKPAQSAGAHIYSGSWGSDENMYSADAVDIDTFSFTNDDFLVVLAAG